MRDTLEPLPVVTTTRTTCPYCGVGCGVLATRNSADGTVTVTGDPDHPANFGRLCSKGTALAETLSLDDRLLTPMINGVDATWEAALDLVAERFSATIAAHGPDSVAFYVSGQLLTEDYYVANKLMKGFIGSANIDTNSRLCMASSVAGHKRAFGSDTVPGTYEDLETADLVVLVGSNLAWCHPVLYQRLAAARAERGTKVVVVDPRRTATCEIADLHLAVSPGSDVALFNGLLAHLVRAKAADDRFVDLHTTGLPPALAAARTMSRKEIIAATGLSDADITAFYDLFTSTERTVTAYSQGVNQSTAGTDKVNAIINCHLLTGRIGRPGMGPFSVTGQPNAMGGREVGGLANMLAAHMDLANADHRATVQKFWRSPVIADKPGLKAVDLFRGVADGRIKAVWIMATNPVDSMPDANAVRQGLAGCPFVVVSDVVRQTDTTAHAHVLLPATAWGEKDGTVTNSERRISRQRAFLPAPGHARADWWQLAEVAKRMGFAAAFDYTTAADIFIEHAQLSAVDNHGSRDFDIGALAEIDATDYDELRPVQWPQPRGMLTPPVRFFADGQFFTTDRRAKFVATAYRAAATSISTDYPLILNTGRVRDQWHTMTRTAKTARLSGHLAEPFLEINATDAKRFGLAAASLARVTSPLGSVIVRTLITDRVTAGSVFASLHWTDQFASQARVDALVADNCDPVSGQPELKFTPVAVAPYTAKWYGFAVMLTVPDTVNAGYWAKARVKAGWQLELAGTEAVDDWAAFARDILAVPEVGDVLAYHDAKVGQVRFAAFDGDRLIGAFFASPEPVAVARSFIVDQLGQSVDPAANGSLARFRLLAGRAGQGQPDNGPLVCACFAVGRNQILAAARGGCVTTDAIGKATSAGTNCGSCRPEIQAIIAGAVHADHRKQAS
jgi:assimilatory nitrate reductase catalytic subunit